MELENPVLRQKNCLRTLEKLKPDRNRSIYRKRFDPVRTGLSTASKRTFGDHRPKLDADSDDCFCFRVEAQRCGWRRQQGTLLNYTPA